MNKNIRLTVILCLLFVALVFVLTYFRITRNNTAASGMSPEELRETGALVYEEPVDLAPFALQDHNGQPFTEETVKGHWSLLFFGFTSCPDICPLTMSELARFYRSEAAAPFRDDTDIIMVSVDPFRDTPENMEEYMTGFHEDFTGVLGDYEVISGLASNLYIAHSEPPANSNEYLIDHSGNILIINPEGKYHGFLESSIKADNIGRAYAQIRADY